MKLDIRLMARGVRCNGYGDLDLSEFENEDYEEVDIRKL